MSKGLKITLIVIGALAAAGLLLGGGIALGRTIFSRGNFTPFGIMRRFDNNPQFQRSGRAQPFDVQPGRPNRGGFNMGPGMMGRFNSNYTGTPISLDSAKQAVEGYIKNLNNSDLALKEIMVFNNNAYGVIIEKSTGKGAMEVLVNPANQAVTPESGPNMMWNLKYSSMGCGGGRMGGMMGGNASCNLNQPNNQTIPEMTVTAEQAQKAAQAYLDKNLVGTQAVDDPMAFYGYYTLDYTKDGKPAGMLSVNGYSSQVWLHNWHGTFIEEWEAQ